MRPTPVFAAVFLTLAAALALAAPTAPTGGNLRISPRMLHFEYSTFDAGTSADCTHSLLNAATQDWKVVCIDGRNGLPHNYVVHLWVTAYTRLVYPKLSYEVLYWVDDYTNPKAPKGTGTTVWFHLKDPTELAMIQISQSVDDNTAGLYLTLDPTKQ